MIKCSGCGAPMPTDKGTFMCSCGARTIVVTGGRTWYNKETAGGAAAYVIAEMLKDNSVRRANELSAEFGLGFTYGSPAPTPPTR